MTDSHPGMFEETSERGYSKPNGAGDSRIINETVATFNKWLVLKDDTPVLATLGAVAANQLDGDPVWLGIVAPPSSAKTEILNSLSLLPYVVQAATLTAAALLSGTPRKDRDKTAKGGLLRQIGSFGVLCLKDFGSVLSMHTETRAELIAALREIADGAWTRHVGVDGGKTLSWKGKLGFVFGATLVIDVYHSVISALGDRWLLIRMAPVKGQLARALKHRGAGTKVMRQELAEAVTRLFDNRKAEPSPITEKEIEHINAIVSLVVRLRGAVERDRRTRQLDAIYGAEGTGRIGLALERLLAGLDVLGVTRKRALEVVESVAFDSAPPQRLKAYRYIEKASKSVVGDGDVWCQTTVVAIALGLPTNTVRRVLEDLAAYRLIERKAGAKGKPDLWRKRAWENEDDEEGARAAEAAAAEEAGDDMEASEAEEAE